MAAVIQDLLDSDQALNVMTIYRINKMLHKYNLKLDRPFCSDTIIISSIRKCIK